VKIAIVSRSGSALQHVIKHLAFQHVGCEPTLISLNLTFRQKIGIATTLKRRIGIVSLTYFVVTKYFETRHILRFIKINKISKSPPDLNFASDSNDLLEFLSLEKFDLLVLGQNVVLPKEVLDAGLNRFVNIHPARLPQYRGYAEPAHAILAGNTEDVGYSLHLVSPHLDQGGLIDFVQVDLRDIDSLNSSLVRVRIKGYDELFRRIAMEGISDLMDCAKPQNYYEAKTVGILPYGKRLALDLRIFRRRLQRRLKMTSSKNSFNEK
jgi:folate-dependent phosphoribosylglycinamide formyltransferase PurN